MPHRRILFLGPTGVDKATVAARLNAHIQKTLGHCFRFVDFEKDFLRTRLKESASKDWMTFLAQDIPVQAATWRRAWDTFKATLTEEITVLGLHATYVSGVLGLRCPVHIPSVCADFRPTLIVTLIDDVFSMWRRTETRAQGEERKGRPTFEQLLSARRAEQILGDLVLSHSEMDGVRHVLCATGNTLDGLANLIVFDASVTYLSFPISAPRELAKAGDKSFIELINGAHAKAAKHMQEDRQRAFISPLSIDELPIVFKARGLPDEQPVTFLRRTAGV